MEMIDCGFARMKSELSVDLMDSTQKGSSGLGRDGHTI